PAGRAGAPPAGSGDHCTGRGLPGRAGDGVLGKPCTDRRTVGAGPPLRTGDGTGAARAAVCRMEARRGRHARVPGGLTDVPWPPARVPAGLTLVAPGHARRAASRRWHPRPPGMARRYPMVRTPAAPRGLTDVP